MFHKISHIMQLHSYQNYDIMQVHSYQNCSDRYKSFPFHFIDNSFSVSSVSDLLFSFVSLQSNHYIVIISFYLNFRIIYKSLTVVLPPSRLVRTSSWSCRALTVSCSTLSVTPLPPPPSTGPRRGSRPPYTPRVHPRGGRPLSRSFSSSSVLLQG